jgi:hypothetical protein
MLLFQSDLNDKMFDWYLANIRMEWGTNVRNIQVFIFLSLTVAIENV